MNRVPSNSPQNAPQPTPRLVFSCPWLIFGFFSPVGHDTVAWSRILISLSASASLSSPTARSAPSELSNFHTVKAVMALIHAPRRPRHITRDG